MHRALTVLGYIGSILIGLTLGLLGSGGSILTVPVLVYLLHYSPVTATGYSLFIVGFTALVGATNYMRKRLVDYTTAMLFAVPSFISVYIVRRFFLPLVPEKIVEAGSFVLHKDLFIMLIFAVMMIAAGYSMVRNRLGDKNEKKTFNYPRIAQQGFIVGAITGLVSVGGGFLIIPSLVLFAKVPIRMAVGTSLIIIATNALVGFTGELHNNPNVDWYFLFYFCLFSVAGIIAGSTISHYIPSEKLKPLFGWFVLVMGGYIVVKELFRF